MKQPTVQRRRRLVPEVVQTSVMDCGPATLKALLEGFHVPVSYGRLRELCQTDVDGTSIDSMEDVARALGLDVIQRIVPVDHLLRPESQSLPGICVARLPSGGTHFVVGWSRVAGLVQVMDPGAGRLWKSTEALASELYVHTHALSEKAACAG